MELEQTKQTDAAARHLAQRRYQHGTDDVEIDDNAGFSYGEDGVWVQAWVWVANDDITKRMEETK